MNENSVPHISRMTKAETAAALAYLPIHIFLLPLLLSLTVVRKGMSSLDANLICYALGFAYMLIYELRFLRRDFDPLCDSPVKCLLTVLSSYAVMMAVNFVVNSVFLSLVPDANNQNNSAVMEMIYTDTRKMEITLVLFAPVLEELMFRGGLFGLARRYSRTAAYALSILGFSLYHVMPYAIYDASYWIYIIQYIPVSFLLTRCYERTESILCSILFHALVNGVSLAAINAVQGLI